LRAHVISQSEVKNLDKRSRLPGSVSGINMAAAWFLLEKPAAIFVDRIV